ncbi:MAG TPA: hypothetical protein VM013_03660 [Dehalococcoidia bacterium]|nr:hypothetical protein [Dehalococcoidia bacterium]
MSVESILAKNRRKLTIDGHEFIVRHMTAGMTVEALGPGAIEVVDMAGDRVVRLKDDDLFRGWDVMRKILKVAMVDPKLGEVSDEKAGTISWEDLGELGPKLHAAVTRDEVQDVADFPQPSQPVQKG